MARREIQHRWEWRLRSSPQALWPLVADTNRFNRDAGVPPLEGGDVGQDGRRHLRLSKLGVAVEWEEEPFEWVEPHRFSVRRRYDSGPVAEMTVTAELRPEPSGGTLLVYRVASRPRNALGTLAIPLQIGLLSRRRFARTFREYDEIASRPEPGGGGARRASLVPGGNRRAAAARETLLGQGLSPELVDRLAELIVSADDMTVARLRPYAFADLWGADRRDVLELFLHATRAGLLELRWDLLCPLCRGAQERGRSLGEVEARVHCPSCAIDFDVDFERSVELSFRPSAAIRDISEREFCVGGPQLTPHIAAQQLLPPGAERSLELTLESGRYRLRTREAPSGRPVLVESAGAREAAVHLDESGWRSGEAALAERASLRLVNSTRREQLFVLERAAWSDQVVTAAEVTTLQVFRDLFSSEALRPDEPISVGSLTLLFTDLRDSTRFYREVGDASAFGSVMEHLDVLHDVVKAEDGAVVKAMGDAIMAVFRRPVFAVRAALRAQREVGSPRAGGRPLLLKAGVHSGPCIAVNQNGRLDYFGSTVNLAARLVALSTGSDVVVSDAVLADPEVSDELAEEIACAEPL
ncbi:MAG: DUF5939 domain-containing protein, partial [Actinomycetota bacterium]|nr:DUF5939 domain-containing protein [Actinomycetota bacterium]